METLSFEELSALIAFHSKQFGMSGAITPHSIDRIAEAAAAYQKQRSEIKANMEAIDAK
jgi:hypothetical protein